MLNSMVFINAPLTPGQLVMIVCPDNVSFMNGCIRRISRQHHSSRLMFVEAINGENQDALYFNVRYLKPIQVLNHEP